MIYEREKKEDSRVPSIYTQEWICQKAAQEPYATCGSGSPGAMKLVNGLPLALAAEHRAMVGELEVELVSHSEPTGRGCR